MRDAVVLHKLIFSQGSATSDPILPKLRSTRLCLRPMQIDDAAQILRLHSELSVNEFLERPELTTISDAESYIHAVHAAIHDGEALAWTIISSITADVIGAMYLWNIYQVDRRAEVSLELLPEYQCNGLGFEAMMSVLKFVFQHLHFHSIEADVDPANSKAISLLQKCGFKKEAYFHEVTYHLGRFRDRAVYSLIDPYPSTNEELPHGQAR